MQLKRYFEARGVPAMPNTAESYLRMCQNLMDAAEAGAEGPFRMRMRRKAAESVHLSRRFETPPWGSLGYPQELGKAWRRAEGNPEMALATCQKMQFWHLWPHV